MSQLSMNTLSRTQRTLAIVVMLVVAVCGYSSYAAKTSENKGDADKLYELIRQARADLRALGVQLGIRGASTEGRREGRGEHAEGSREGRGEHGEGRHEGRGEHAEGRRESRGEHAEGRRESRGEHGERSREGHGEHREGRHEGRGEHGEGSGEEGGVRVRKNEKWDKTRNGARLILAYNAATQSFKGTVQNTTSRILSEVRVEVHRSNRVELGPTKRIDLKPGQKIPVELSAASQRFTWWTTHPEHGSEEGHGPGHEGEGRGEHGEGDGRRPKDSTLRPLYNQIQLLRQEIKIISNALKSKERLGRLSSNGPMRPHTLTSVYSSKPVLSTDTGFFFTFGKD